MAPEVSLKGEMLESACIVDLKAIDVWALSITFLILNPDQPFPSQLDIMETAPTELTVLLIDF